MDMLKDALSVVEVVEAYQRSWSADAEERERLLELSHTEDAELVQPNGRSLGRDGVARRIGGLADRWPGAHVDITSGLDEHHGFVRYGGMLKNAEFVILAGFGAGELAADGRLRRVIQFFDPAPAIGR